MAYCKANQLDCNGFCNRFDAPCIKKNCRFFGVKTNADRIRTLNDHELAETISNFVSDIDGGDVRYSDDPNDWLEWLQQPAKEGHDAPTL